ncbi:MAG: class I SAM-dependent methyltransferase [Pseudonocardiaceae bacterium]
MGIADTLAAGVARQLAHPSGRPGRLVGRVLNLANRAVISAAVDALELQPGQVAVDVGFGGGAGLAMLLDRAGSQGRVHGVEVSGAMFAGASHRFRKAITAGTLELHKTPMTELPLDDASVDGIITVNTIYFVDSLDRAFAEVAGVLKPSGRFVVGIRDPDAMAKMPVTAHGFRIRPVDEVIDALEAHELRLVDHRRVGTGVRTTHLLVTTPTT